MDPPYETLDLVLRVQSRIESKVDLLASLLRDSLDRKSTAVRNSEISSASNSMPTVRATDKNEAESDVESPDSPRIVELSRAWKRPSVTSARSDSRNDTKLSYRRRSASDLDKWPQSIELLLRYANFCDEAANSLELEAPILESRSVKRMLSVKAQAANSSSLAIPPNSPMLLSWALFAAIIITFDSSATGLFLIWSFPGREAAKIVFAACWTLDLIVNSFKGHRGSGGDTLPLEKSFLRYLRTWFAMDLSLVCCDWALIASTAIFDTDLSAWSIINFLRVYKFVLFVENVTALRSSVRMVVCLRSISFLVYTLWSLHIFACFWLAIGLYSPSDTGKHWVDTAEDFPSDPDLYQYTTSVHWVVSYANMGNIEMFCQNTVERISCTFFMLVSFFLGSIAVSYLAALLFDFRLSSRDQTQQLQTLKRFLQENAVESSVATSVIAQARVRLSRLNARLAYADVRCLSLLSSSMVKELKYALVGRFFQKHALFRFWMRNNSAVAKDLSAAIDFSPIVPGTTLFKPLVRGTDMFYLISGKMVFMQDVSTSLVLSPRSVTVEVGTWFCEAAMWTRWVHVGTMEAIDTCEVTFVHADEAARLLKQDETIFRIAAAYADAFHHRIVTAGPPRTAWPDDLHVPLTNYADLVMHFPNDVLLYIGMEAVEIFSRESFSHSLWTGKYKKLEREVKTGKCVLMVNGQGDVERIVAVLVLQLQNSSGQVLYELGKLNPEHVFKVGFRMPGKKRERGEEVLDTINRSPKLMRLCGASDIIQQELQEKYEFSKEYGVRTNYLRAVQTAKLRDEEIIIAFEPDPKLACADTGMRQEAQDLSSYNVCAVNDDEELTVYAWLDEEKAKLLESEKGEAIIKAWMSCFDLVACFSEFGMEGVV